MFVCTELPNTARAVSSWDNTKPFSTPHSEVLEISESTDQNKTKNYLTGKPDPGDWRQLTGTQFLTSAT